ncbi:hypothetical protein B0H13DRAFT_2393052 [Mycena leptocephala]|nr:hypothetical protein B0H13DRAFT_2393052 [Mycena leptocephala]
MGAIVSGTTAIGLAAGRSKRTVKRSARALQAEESESSDSEGDEYEDEDEDEEELNSGDDFTVAFDLLHRYNHGDLQLPIVPMYIFKHSTVTGVFIEMFINGFVFVSILYLLPQFFRVALGYDPLQAGLFLIPFLVTQVFSSWGGGMLVSHTGYYRVRSSIRDSPFGPLPVVAYPPSALFAQKSPSGVHDSRSIGAGLTMQTSTLAVQASVPRRDMAVVTAMRNIRQIIDNPVLLHTPVSLGVSHDIATAIPERGYTKGFSSLFILNAALTVLATLVSDVMIKHKELSRDDDEMLRQQALREKFEKNVGWRAAR